MVLRVCVYLNSGSVVTQEALVLQRDMDALLGPEVDSGTRGPHVQVEHVLLQRGGRLRERFEVSPLLSARYDTTHRD